LQAQISSADVARAGTARVTIFTSGRFGGTSTALNFRINPVPTTSSTTSTTTSTTTTSTPSTKTTTTSTTAALAITTTSVPRGTAGASYPTTALAASGGSPTYTWSIPSGGGALPPGLALTAAGAIAGTPTTAGTSSFTAQATDTAGAVAQKAFSLAIAAPPTTSTGGTALFQTGFEDGSVLSGFDFIWTTTDVTLNANPQFVHSGSYSAQMHYVLCGATDGTCGDSSQDSNRYFIKYFNSTNGYPNGLDHFFMRGYVYFKSPEVGGTKDGVQRKIMWVQDANQQWSFFITSDSSNGLMPVRFSTNGNTYVAAYTYWDIATIAYDQWYCLEMEVQLNTPGSSDGAIKFWANGSQVWQMTGLNLRGGFTTGAGQASFGRQTNRYNYNPIDEYRYWDDLVVSTSYVGP